MKKFAAIILAMGIIGLCVAAPAHAANGLGVSFALCPSSHGCPAPTATVAPTPVPGALADPQANQATINEYHYLQSLMTASSRHLISGNEDVARQAANGNLAGSVQANYAANGNQYDGLSSDDYCAINWPNSSTTRSCLFGTGSDAYNGLLNAWNRGELVQLSIHFPNPFDNYNIGINSGAGTTCPAFSSSTKGSADDCYAPSGNLGADVATMATAGTQYNNQWHIELSNWVTELQRLQNNNVVVIVRLFHEIDDPWSWWAAAAQQNPGAVQALFVDTEHYFESQGIHNALYEYCILSGVVAYPGNAYIDILGLDNYPPGNGFAPGGYGALAALSPTKPQSSPEYDCQPGHGTCDSTFNFNNYFLTWQQYEPNVVFISYWAGLNPGAGGDRGSNLNPYWTGNMTTNTYLALQPSTSARPR